MFESIIPKTVLTRVIKLGPFASIYKKNFAKLLEGILCNGGGNNNRNFFSLSLEIKKELWL